MRAALDKERFGPWALVTGASSGIGKEFARQIAASGINIVLVARREDLLKEVGVQFSKRCGVEHRVVVDCRMPFLNAKPSQNDGRIEQLHGSFAVSAHVNDRVGRFIWVPENRV